MDLKALDDAVDQLFAYGPSKVPDKKTGRPASSKTKTDKAKTAQHAPERHGKQTKGMTKQGT